MKAPAAIDEKYLLYKLRDGDEAAFKEIYYRYAGMLYERLLRLLKDPDQVDELLQDLFLRLWERRSQLDPEQAFKTYVYKMADHLAIDLFRKVSRDKKLQAALWETASLHYSHIEENLISKEDQVLLQEAIDQLPPQQKAVLLLCKMEGKSYKEAAELLQLSPSTVSNHLVQALKTIRAYLTRPQNGLLPILLLFLFNDF